MNRLQEALFFYTGADYLVINAFLWRNQKALLPCIEIVQQNNRGMISEALASTPGQRFDTSEEEGELILAAYRRRTLDLSSSNALRQIIELAIEDIRIICRAMQPALSDLVLYRNVSEKYFPHHPAIGQILDLPGLTSTSTTGQEINYGKDDFHSASFQYKIMLSKRTPMLALENDSREENEVLLPPMQYRITEIAEAKNQRILSLAPIALLDIEELIASADIAFDL